MRTIKALALLATTAALALSASGSASAKLHCRRGYTVKHGHCVKKKAPIQQHIQQ